MRGISNKYSGGDCRKVCRSITETAMPNELKSYRNFSPGLPACRMIVTANLKSKRRASLGKCQGIFLFCQGTNDYLLTLPEQQYSHARILMNRKRRKENRCKMIAMILYLIGKEAKTDDEGKQELRV